MSIEILDCLKPKRDICITAFRWTPASKSHPIYSKKKDGGCTFYHNTLRTKLSPLGIWKVYGKIPLLFRASRGQESERSGVENKPTKPCGYLTCHLGSFTGYTQNPKMVCYIFAPNLLFCDY